MSPEATLAELLDRVGSGRGAAVFVNEEELSQWPVAAVKALKSQKLIVRARPAASAICPGCERECAMPVHTPSTTVRSLESFIVCDKRSDINRVPVPAARLVQWQCSTGAVCGFIATSLGIRRSEAPTGISELWNIGMVTGSMRSQMLCLQADGALNVVAGDGVAPLSDLIGFDQRKYSIDGVRVRQLIDAATTVDPRYTPSNARREVRKLATKSKHESWQREYLKLKKKNPKKSDVWCSQQIAKMDIAGGSAAGTIRKNMKK
jgi:hypothetical protein